MPKKSIIGASHVPRIAKGVYAIGNPCAEIEYNYGPSTWRTHTPKSFGGAMKSMQKEFFGKSMCGDCIGIKVTGGHDRNIHNRRKCQLCGTIWPGLEPDNDRRGAIEAQRARRASFHCPSCQDVGCALCL